MTAMFLIGVSAAAMSLCMLDLRRDTRRERERVEVERITAPLPVVLTDLSGGWPVRQSPTDLAAAYEELPAMYRTTPVPEMTWLTTGYLAPHEQVRWPVIRDRLRRERALLTEFHEIVGAVWSVADWCDSCRTGRDGERTHQSCVGCPCPCLTVEVTA